MKGNLRYPDLQTLTNKRATRGPMLPDDQKILKLLKDQRDFDFSGYRPAMIKRRLEQRLAKANCRYSQAYLKYLIVQPEELDSLLSALTINVSRFFRETLTFEYLGDRILFTLPGRPVSTRSRNHVPG
jgi:chemotaxis protein methyltransferase CheR